MYSEIVPSDVPADEILARKPAAVVLSGGPSSVYAPGAPQVDPSLFEGGVPAFGICYGFQAMAASLGGTVARTGDREYGGTPLTVTTEGRLFGDLPLEQVLLGPAEQADGRTNLFGALRRTMAKTGYRDLKEFQRVDLVIGGHVTGETAD